MSDGSLSLGLREKCLWLVDGVGCWWKGIFCPRRFFPGLVWLVSLFVIWLVWAPGRAAAVIEPANVLVVYNEASADGAQIASYYAQARPGVQLLGLTGVSTEEEISADEYLASMRPQILAALDDSIDVIVTTKGLPLRITTDPNANPGTYVDPFGVERTVFSSTWKRYSSLESELTRIDAFSTWQQLGDQTYWLPEDALGAPHPSANPYYQAGGSFDQTTYDMRLATRLDGFTVDDVLASIDRAQRAFVGPDGQRAGPFQFVLDDDPNAQAGFPDDMMESLQANVLAPRGLASTYDATDSFLQTAPGPVLAYVSHGVHGGAPPDYLTNPEDGIKFQLADGAVFHSYESFNAKSFDPAFSSSQGLLAQWIARGGTAGLGHVQEPLSGPANVSNEDVVFQMLLDGYSWAEAAWSGTAQLSYVNTVVGDPLMVFRQLITGDANRDGRVNALDLALAGAHFGEHGEPGGAMWGVGDFNSDGRVNAADLALIGANWGATAEWLAATPGPGQTAVAVTPTPEPSAAVLALLGCVLLAAGRRCLANPDTSSFFRAIRVIRGSLFPI